jgi:hypothetical protein
MKFEVIGSFGVVGGLEAEGGEIENGFNSFSVVGGLEVEGGGIENGKILSDCGLLLNSADFHQS